VLLSGTMVRGQGTAEETAAKVKAGLVYHLSELTQWPEKRFEQETTPITLGVLGADPHGFANYFRSQAATFTAQGRRFVVRELSFQVVPSGQADLAPALKNEMRECHILFVTKAASRHLAPILSAVEGAGVLTVGESEAFSTSGGMVSFAIDKSIVKIHVNLRALKKGHIKTSSEFLRHAQLVEDGHESE
jgi:hypothetical protein